MPKGKEETKFSSIPSYILEAISSLSPHTLLHSESCPLYPLEGLDIQERLDGNIKKKEKEKEYKIGNYLIKKTLGQGTFGKVKLGVYIPTQEKVAIKILEKDRIIEKDDEIRVKREFDMLALFNHPNVILVAEIFESSDSYYSVMEYCQGGELFNYIVKNRRLSEEEAAFFYYQLINGLEYIHSLGIVHRDLKPENLLLTSEHLLKIIDFGLSNYFKNGQQELLSTPCGSPCYASPEMVGGKKYNGFKIDIWSTGIILYAMLCGYLPFEDKDNDVLFEKILECKLIFPKYITEISKDLMQKILVTNPEERITIPEIKNHPFYLKGKDLFEQEFSIYQITKDANDKASIVENIDLNHILYNPITIEADKNIIENKENIEDNNKNKENLNVVEKDKEKKEGKIIEIKKPEKIKEIEIEIEINNDKNKDIKKNEKENNIEEKGIPKKLINKEIIDYELEQRNTKQDSKTKTDENIFIPQKEFIDSLERETNKKDIDIRNISSIKQNTIGENDNNKKNNKNKISNNIIKGINTTTKKSDFSKNRGKIVTLIKDKDYQNSIRRKLIKNNHKLNIREKTKSRVFKSSKKPSKRIEYNNYKRLPFHRKKMEVTPNLKNDKYNSKKLINKRINNSKLFHKKIGSKENIQKNNLIYKGNTFSNHKYNNTIDDENNPKKIKFHFNFQRLNISGLKSAKRARSVAKHNLKLNSFETSKIRRDRNFLDNIYKIYTSSKKKNSKSINRSKNKNQYLIKYNLLHKKNSNEININLRNIKKNNKYLDGDNKRSIAKTEIIKERKKNLEIKGIKKMKLPPSINTENISNKTNIKIVDESKEDINDINKKKNQKNYDTKTNIKKPNDKKIFKQINGKISKGNSEYIIRTFDKEKHDRFMRQNLNKYNRISGNLNNYLKNFEHKNTIDIEEKNHKINIDISTNLGCIKNKNINNTIEHQNSLKKNNKKIKKRQASNKTDLIEKNNLNLNLDLNNKNLNLRDNYPNNKNYNIKEIENILKTEPSKRPPQPYNKNTIVTENGDDEKNKLIHVRRTQNNPINYKKNKNIKKNNIPKNLNKTSNSSNYNSFIKNPFMPNESTNFNTINQSSNNSYNIQGLNNPNKKTNNKNSHKTLNSKKKPYVTIRNTVINFNMIDSGLILASINSKKNNDKKRLGSMHPNNSFNKLQNNHLYNLCKKFNNSLIDNKNNTISIKTKTINTNSNNSLHFNSKKILNAQNLKKVNNLSNKKFISSRDKMHMKFNSMKIEDFNGLKRKKKAINNIKINTLGTAFNNKLINIELNHYNTISKEEFEHSNENNKNLYMKNKNK